MCFKRLTFILFCVASRPAFGETMGLSVGAAVTPAPALSVQYAPSPDHAYHFTSSYSGDGARMSADYQRLVVPSFGYGRDWKLSFYSGLGLGGESHRDAATNEDYRLRLPLGAQCDFHEFHVSTFVEAAGVVGPLPVTHLAAAYAGGLRATF